nr:cytochrome c oxidase subunit I [Pseudomonadota bacterium]
MNTPRDDAALKKAQEEQLLKAWASPRGWSVLSDVNNTAIGLWYTVATFVFLLLGGVLALLMRWQLAVPGNDFLGPEAYNQIFTMHGSVMMFLVAVPFLEAVAVYLLPQLLGARDLPFPRLSAYGFWCYIIGGVAVFGSIFFLKAPDGGWFMYPPLTGPDYSPGVGADIWLLGLSFVEIASLAAAVELIVGVLKTRPPGMSINLIPLYAWYILATAVMILFAFPPLIAGDLLLELERAFHWPFFDPARGGDPLLWQHLFWIFGHPEVYIVFLPAVGVVAMIVPTFAQRPVVGYSWIVLAAVGTGFISFGLWVHHMFATGLPLLSLSFFSAASEAVVIPTGVQLFAFIATLLLGRVRFETPMLFVMGFLFIFVLGGLTGVMVAIVPFDLQVHDSYFIVAHLHHTLIGGMLFPMFAALYYWMPVVSGRMLRPRLGKWAFWLLFIGFLVTFFPMHFTGLLGMPRRVYTYPEGLGWDGLNLTSSIGAFVFAAGILVLLYDVITHFRRGEKAPRNPWNAGSLDWMMEIPPRDWGARSVPIIKSRYPLWEQENFLDDVDNGRFLLADAPDLRRETIITTVVDARPIQVLRVPGPSWWPLLAAVATGGFFIASTFHAWVIAGVSAAAAFVLLLGWVWNTAENPQVSRRDAGCGYVLPLYQSGPHSVGWWALFITLLGDAAAFVSLIFAYFFYWTVNPAWPPPQYDPLNPVPPAIIAGLLLGASLLVQWAIKTLNRGAAGRFKAAVGLGTLAWPAIAALQLLWLRDSGLEPTAHSYPAIIWALFVYHLLHVALALIMGPYLLARFWARRLEPGRDIDLRNTALFWHYTVIQGLVTLAVVVLFPLAAG